MDDFGDDLFDEFEKPSVSSISPIVRKLDDKHEYSEEKYVLRY